MKKALFWLPAFVLCWISACILHASEKEGTVPRGYAYYSEKRIEALNDAIYIFEHLIPRYYIGAISNSEDCVSKTLKQGFSACLDKYSTYLTKEEVAAEEKARAETAYTGIGIEIEKRDEGVIVIVDVFEGSPAAMAGVVINDIIVKVDGHSTKGENIQQVARLIQGLEGTDVIVSVLRDGSEKELKITRSKVNYQNVSYRVISPGLGYLSLKSFNKDKAYQDFYGALRELSRRGASGRMIIDLRNNGGGMVSETLKILALFHASRNDILIAEQERDMFGNVLVNETSVSSVLLRHPRIIFSYGEYAKSKIVVLVNQNTASAAEMAAGTLREIGAVVVGEKTYGKGVEQELKGLPSGAMLKLTTREYFVGARHVKINGIGVTVDVEIKNPDGWTRGDIARDEQLKKAIEILHSK